MKAELVDSQKALAALEADWWRLFEAMPAITPFSSPAWLLPWWDAFAPGELSSVAIRKAGELVGFAPLYREDGPYGRRLLPLGIGVSDYADVLLHPDHFDGAGACLFACLAAMRNRWDVWSAEELPPEAATLRLAPGPAWVSELRPGSRCPVLPLRPGAPAADAVPSGQKRKWNLARNRVARRNGEIRAATPETAEADLGHLFRLHGARWEERGQSGVLAPDPVQRFHAAAVPRLGSAGLLRMISLAFGDTVAGVYYGLKHHDRAYAYLTGFDPGFAFESPGTIVLGAAIEAAVADGCREFHFLRGEESYKYGWGAVDRLNSTRLFRLTT